MKVTSRIHKDPIFNRPTSQFLTCQLKHEHNLHVQQLEYKALRTKLRCIHPRPVPLDPRREEDIEDPFLQQRDSRVEEQPRYYLTALPAILPPRQKLNFESSEEEGPPEPTNISLFLHFRSLLDDLARRGLDFQQIIINNFQAMKLRECGKQQIKVTLKTAKDKTRHTRSILRDLNQIEAERRNFIEQVIQLGTGSDLQYFDAIMDQKFDNPKGAKRRLRKVFECLSRLFVRLIQKNI